MNTRAKNARGGFTLVEVLAAMVLIGVVLPIAMTAVSNALHVASVARHSAEAARLAQSKLEELQLSGDSLASGGGDFGQDYPRYKWTSQVGTSANEYGLVEVRVFVTWLDRNQDRSVSVSTFVSDSSTSGTSTSLTGGL